MTTAAARSHCVDTSSTLAHFEFELPPELIAQEPVTCRDQARLMVVDRATGSRQHSSVRSLAQHLRPGDLLIINDTRVIPARLRGRLPSGGRVELLALYAGATNPDSKPRWVCMAKPAKRLRHDLQISLDGDAQARIVRLLENGRCEVEFATASPFLEYLEQYGEIPLPPYIRRPDGPRANDLARYQTIFARPPGAIAAPTAGLHFTEDLIEDLRHHSIEIAPLTLHVGPGTFLPIRDDDFSAHAMQAEWYEISTATVNAIRSAKAERRRVIAIGTTTTRALESAAAATGTLRPGSGWADLFITPGHTFRIVDSLFTNFHLPKSTLLLLVSAFGGRDRVLDAYREAVAARYRFYSYGDAMLLS